MMLKKLTAAVIAASTAMVPFTADAMNAFIPMNVYAESTFAAGKLPDWVPDDFESALEFRNTYGTTHIQDGLLCLVFDEKRECERKSGSIKDTPHYTVYTTGSIMKTLKNNTYGTTSSISDYEVIVYKPEKSGNFEISLIDNWVKSSSLESETGFIDYRTYNTFSVDDNMNITETDHFSWMPDCLKEYQEYEMENGGISVKDNMIVFCLDSAVGTPYTWQMMLTGISDYFEEYDLYDCSEETEFPLDGGVQHLMRVFKATNDGSVKIDYEYRDDLISDPKKPPEQSIVEECVILDNAQTILLPGDVRIELIDFDTNKPVEITPDSGFVITESGDKLQSEAFSYTIISNPMIIRDVDFELAENLVLKVDDGYSVPITTEETKSIFKNIRYDNGSWNNIFKVRKNMNSEIPENSTKITFYDKDTDELIEIPNGKNNIYLKKNTDYLHPFSDTYKITSNPCIIDVVNVYNPDFLYFINVKSGAGCYESPEFEVISEDANRTELKCRLKWKASGDANGDEEFNISDAVILQKWLHGSDKTIDFDWKALDFCRDNKLDIFDFIYLKRELLKEYVTEYVEPDERIDYGVPFYTGTDESKLYLGPDEKYSVITSIPRNTRLREIGYQNNNNKWLFTEYEGKQGWIKVFQDDDQTPAVYYEMAAAKPVIYLYPEKETDVHVELELTESELNTTYPKYNNGWDVTASPDGSLINKADGTHHKYLFWDSKNCRTRFDFSKGFCVAGSDTEKFLKEKLTYMGLTEDEMNEFIVYWLPLMEHNKYNLISFQNEAYTNSAKLNITPVPDSECRIFMAYVPLENAVDIEPQQLETFERKGFSVVEWGGSVIR